MSTAKFDTWQDRNGTRTFYGTHTYGHLDATSGAPTITESANISSMTDNGVGDYTANMSTALSSATYQCLGSSGGANGVPDMNVSFHRVNSTGNEVAPTTSAFRISVSDVNNASRDPNHIVFTVMGGI